MRFYGFKIDEVLNKDYPNLDLDVDPKMSWALRNMQYFPIDINRASKADLARVPGIGLKSVYKILQARKFKKLRLSHLKTIGVAINRARYFILTGDRTFTSLDMQPHIIRSKVLQNSQSKFRGQVSTQIPLFT
jgi:predicted DNA-binding helix-hairpin-helix protein